MHAIAQLKFRDCGRKSLGSMGGKTHESKPTYLRCKNLKESQLRLATD